MPAANKQTARHRLLPQDSAYRLEQQWYETWPGQDVIACLMVSLQPTDDDQPDVTFVSGSRQPDDPLLEDGSHPYQFEHLSDVAFCILDSSDLWHSLQNHAVAPTMST